MQNTIKDHCDKGAAGGTFSSYKIIQVQRVVNTRIWSSYSYRRLEIAAAVGCANERMLFHGTILI